jgi:hypothetical protein
LGPTCGSPAVPGSAAGNFLSTTLARVFATRRCARATMRRHPMISCGDRRGCGRSFSGAPLLAVRRRLRRHGVHFPRVDAMETLVLLVPRGQETQRDTFPTFRFRLQRVCKATRRFAVEAVRRERARRMREALLFPSAENGRTVLVDASCRAQRARREVRAAETGGGISLRSGERGGVSGVGRL